MMLCVSLARLNFEECLEALTRFPLCELRFDLLDFGQRCRELVAHGAAVIATFRAADNFTEVERLSVLTEAIKAGAAFVDIDLNESAHFRRELLDTARATGCKVIISYHDFDGTPTREVLLEIIKRCFAEGAAIAKIACTVRTQRDNANLLGLLDSDHSLAVVGMGEKGQLARLVAPAIGSAIAYVAVDEKHQSAPGQLSFEQYQALSAQMRIFH